MAETPASAATSLIVTAELERRGDRVLIVGFRFARGWFPFVKSTICFPG
jgi:hypothetical protein